MVDNGDLIEEIFCLKYELDTLANVLLRNESERWVPGFLNQSTEHSHTQRYEFACKFSEGKHVLDVACGIGKGSNIIATRGRANTVNGFDLQPEAIRYAKWRNSAPNIQFAIGNAQALGITNQYDLAVSFETVEHLPNYKDFFTSISASLKNGGQFLISTPISALEVDSKPANPYHIQEWGFLKFQEILSAYFKIEKVFVQLYPFVAPLQQPQRSLLYRVVNKIKRLTSKGVIPVLAVKSEADKISIIEEFTGQYDINELGKARIGYQIVLLRKEGL